MNVHKIRWQIAQWFERKWWKRYLNNKDVVEYKKWKLNYWQNFYNLFSDIVPLTANTIVLDAGCGPAGIFMLLKDCQYVEAIDPLLQAYEKDLIHFKKQYYSYVNFSNTSIEEYNKQEAFDVVFCINAINHVKDLQKGIYNLVNATKKNGKIVISTDVHNFNFLKKLFQLVPGDILHPHQYNLTEYKSYFEKNGIQIHKTIKIKKEFIFSYYVFIGEKK